MLDVLPLTIVDGPAFAWRGYMVDTSRHFIPIDELLRGIDAAAAAKLNVFHWHIVDSPSFPMASAKYPELAEQGSWSRSNATIYSKDDIAKVIARADSRFVQVVSVPASMAVAVAGAGAYMAHHCMFSRTISSSVCVWPVCQPCMHLFVRHVIGLCFGMKTRRL